MLFLVFQKIRDKLKKVPGKPENVPDRPGTVPVRLVPSGNVPVRRFSPGVNARVPVSNARSGGIPVRRVASVSGFVRSDSRGTQSPVRRVSQGGVPGRVPVRLVPSGNVPVRRFSPGVNARVPVSNARSGGIPVRRVVPGSGAGRVSVRRVPPVASGVRPRVPVSNVQSGRVPPGSVPVRRPVQQQSPYARRVAPGSVPGRVPVRRVPPGSVPVRRPVQQQSPYARRVVPGGGIPARAPVNRPARPVAGRIIPDSGLGISPAKSVSVSGFSVFRDKFGDVFGGVKDKFEDVFGGVSDRFDNFRYVADFLRGYWWAILVVLGVAGLIFVLSYSDIVDVPEAFSEACRFPISVECRDYSVKNDSIELRLENVAGKSMIVKNIKATSDSGTCELAPIQRGLKLKKDGTLSFNLNVTPIVGLSAEGPSGGVNGWNLLADDIMLVRAQGSPTHTPSFVPTAESIQCTVRNEARSYISSVSDRRLRNVLSHYTDLVVGNATDPNPGQNSNLAHLRAAEKASNTKDNIVNAVRTATQDIASQAGSTAPVVSGDNVEEVRQAIDDAVNDFSGSSGTNPIKYQAALYVKDFAYGHDAAELVRTSDEFADEVIAEATRRLNGITEAARDEKDRTINVAGVQKEVRDFAESYANRDSYFAVDFIADAVERASDANEIRKNANDALSTARGDKYAGLQRYYRGHTGMSQVTYRPRYIGIGSQGGPPYVEVSFVNYFPAFSIPSHFSRSRDGPVVSHYHDLIIERLDEYVAELYRTEDANLLDDPNLNNNNPNFNTDLNTGLYRRYSSLTGSLTAGPSNAALDIHNLVRRLTQNSDLTTVIQVAQDETNKVGVGDIYLTPAADFVNARITGSSESAVVSNVESAVRQAISKTTEGARHVADEAERASRAGPTTPVDDPVADIKNYVSQNYPRSHIAHDAAVFIVESNIRGSNADAVADNVERVGREILKAVTLAVGNLSEAAVYENSCSDCSAYCFDFFCEYFDPTKSYDVKLIPWCSQYERYCEKYSDNCVCSRSGGSCSSDADCCGSLACRSGTCEIEVVCGSVGEVCCSGGVCGSGFECVSGMCLVEAVCGSVGEVCCSGGVCGSGFECVSGMCLVEAVCGSVGEVCCSGGVCGSGFECVSGMCLVEAVCGSVGEVCCSGGVCGSGFECRSGVCEVSCGAEDQMCCASGDQCVGDFVCVGSGTGSTCQPCGSGGQVCCSQRTCSEGFDCTGSGTGMCMGDCGSQGQQCCVGGTECGVDLVCVGSGGDGTCQSCGEKDQVCCATGDECSGSGFECVSGTCTEAEECGSEGEVCCSRGDECVSGFECTSGTCRVEEECGSEGEVCCAYDNCALGLECRLDTCVVAVCGGEGEVCCRFNECDSDFECVNSRCGVFDSADGVVQHFSFDTLAPGLNTSVTVTKVGIPFSLIQFTVSEEVVDAEFNVTSRSELPPGVSGSPVGVRPYGYVTVNSEVLSGGVVSPVGVEFSVDKGFFSGVSVDYVRVFEYNQESHAWDRLDEPVHLFEDEDYHHFSVVFDGLVGDFVIALEKFVGCSGFSVVGGGGSYDVELVYSWEDSLEVNHRVAGKLLANSPE